MAPSRRWIKETLGIAALATGIGLGFNAASPSGLPLDRPLPAPAPDPRALSPEGAKAAFDAGRTIFVDARDPKEFAAGRIAGALNLPASTFAESYVAVARLLPREAPVVVYCGSRACDQARRLADRLGEVGHPGVKIFVDGLEVWKARGWPVE